MRRSKVSICHRVGLHAQVGEEPVQRHQLAVQRTGQGVADVGLDALAVRLQGFRVAGPVNEVRGRLVSSARRFTCRSVELQRAPRRLLQQHLAAAGDRAIRGAAAEFGARAFRCPPVAATGATCRRAGAAAGAAGPRRRAGRWMKSITAFQCHDAAAHGLATVALPRSAVTGARAWKACAFTLASCRSTCCAGCVRQGWMAACAWMRAASAAATSPAAAHPVAGPVARHRHRRGCQWP